MTIGRILVGIAALTILLLLALFLFEPPLGVEGVDSFKIVLIG